MAVLDRFVANSFRLTNSRLMKEPTAPESHGTEHCIPAILPEKKKVCWGWFGFVVHKRCTSSGRDPVGMQPGDALIKVPQTRIPTYRWRIREYTWTRESTRRQIVSLPCIGHSLCTGSHTCTGVYHNSSISSDIKSRSHSVSSAQACKAINSASAILTDTIGCLLVRHFTALSFR